MKKGVKGLRSLDDVLAALPEEERKLVEARGAELIARVRRRMTLAEMHKGQKISQAALAETLGSWADADFAAGEAERPAVFDDPEDRGYDGWNADAGGDVADQEPMVLVTE